MMNAVTVITSHCEHYEMLSLAVKNSLLVTDHGAPISDRVLSVHTYTGMRNL